jgi:Phosphoesterase family
VIAKPAPSTEPLSLTVRDRWLLWIAIHAACLLIATVERLPRPVTRSSWSTSRRYLPRTLRRGTDHISSIMASNAWKSAVVVTFDNSAGIWDRVPPPFVDVRRAGTRCRP